MEMFYRIYWRIVIFSKDFLSFSLEFYCGDKPDKYYGFKLP